MVENKDEFIDDELSKVSTPCAVLSNCNLGDERITYLANSLKTNTITTHVNISNNKFGVEGVVALAEAIKVNSTLLDIDFSGNNLKQEGFKALGEALKVNKSLEKLTFDETAVLPEGVNINDYKNPLEYIIEGLKPNQKLKTIYMNANNLTDNIIPAFLSLFESNKVIHNIHVNWNEFSDEGKKTLDKTDRNIIY